MPAGVQPERILRDLSELWFNLAHPADGPATTSGVLRACAMTLLVAAEDEADAQAAGEILGELMHEHPSRAIMLKPSAQADLSARVFAQCWMPFGSRQQICCEQIEIAAGHDRLGDMPGLILGLLAPDLPVTLWCRGESWFSQPHFAQLLPLVDKLIVDSARFSDPSSAFTLIAELSAGGNRVADLEWARLTGWREIISQMFDTPAEMETAAGIRSIRLGHAGESPTSQVYYLAAWLERALPQASLSIQSTGREGSGVCTIDLDSISFRVQSGSAVECHAGPTTHTTLLPDSGDYLAMRQELAITRRDRIFEELCPAARKLAARR